jgi:hypothetical protein
MTILTKIQNTRSSIKNYIIPFLVVLTLYIIFHIPVDDFLYTTANRLQNDILLFWIFIAATAIVYIFGFLIWLEYKNKLIKYQVHQKLGKYKYTLKALAVIGGICTVWRILHFYPTFNNPQINFDDWCYIGIAASLCINVVFLLYISWLYGGKDNTTKTDTDKKEIKADSVETAVVEIEGKNEPNEPFIIARNGLKSVIDRVYSNDTANMGNESYIIGVNGEWGSGKSTLIELVKRQMKDDVHIIDFNPWTSHQPANLPVDFFRTIAASIGSFTMRRTIVHYGLALTKIAKKDIGNIIETLLGKKSLDAQLNEIGDYIKHRNLKLLIIIDDIDRMDGDEILAVLKLARRSGNLPNTVYLLAFNHDYVEAQICQKIKGKNDDGNDSFNYIDKIINLPFDVPKLDWFSKLDTLLLYPFLKDSSSIKTESYMLPDIVKNKITNYRAYKKIYNKIITQYITYKDHVFLNDFILLKTLQIYDIDLYNTLINAIIETRNTFKRDGYPIELAISKDGSSKIIKEFEQLLTCFNNIISQNRELKERNNDINLLSNFLKNYNYGPFFGRRLTISALKIDKNLPLTDSFDTLDYSPSNFENIKDQIKNYPSRIMLMYEFTFYSNRNDYSNGVKGHEEFLNMSIYFLYVNHTYITDQRDKIISSIIEVMNTNNFENNIFLSKIEKYAKEFNNYSIHEEIIDYIEKEHNDYYSKFRNDFKQFIKKMEEIAHYSIEFPASNETI